TSHNERLEFLGDSILNCIIAQALYERFLDVREGDLSRLRANLVRQETLAEIAQGLGLGEQLRLGEGELKSGGFRRPSILADGLEALFGAVFLDGGFDRARETVLRLFEPYLSKLDPQHSGKDAKTTLQEFLQGRRLALPQYLLRATRGEAHAQEFEVECLIPELGITAIGRGTSRRSAEQEAAKRAFEQTGAK
ncbi:MAG: ribonuclease III, partial [Betaproteobacteria bacterium RBG_19FT_COMBO_58_11]